MAWSIIHLFKPPLDKKDKLLYKQAGDSQLALASVNHYLEDAKKSLSYLLNE